MNRPYYISTPRNRYGECLVHPSNNVKHEIRSVHTGDKKYGEAKNKKDLFAKVEELNAKHQIKMAYAMFI
jgi:hypothetical protein